MDCLEAANMHEMKQKQYWMVKKIKEAYSSTKKSPPFITTTAAKAMHPSKHVHRLMIIEF
jgi:hypothetical protein